MGSRSPSRVRRRLPTWLAGLVSPGLVLVLTGCGGADTADDRDPGAASAAGSPATSSSAAPSASDGSSSAPGSSESQRASAGAAGVVVRTGSSAYGRMLFDGRQQAIYLFDREVGTRPRCYGECAAAWPPVLTDGEPRPTGGVRDGLLGTVQRRDGSVQVTYGGHPLYYYAHEGPGQVLCHDVVEYGGRWLVVTPQGDAAPA